jgi:hypothetical protein
VFRPSSFSPLLPFNSRIPFNADKDQVNKGFSWTDIAHWPVASLRLFTDAGDAEPLMSSLNAPSEADEPLPTQSPSGTPGSAVGGSSITAVGFVHVRDVSPNEDDAPPAKRARKFSDADQFSAHRAVAHVSSLCLVRHR